MKKIIGIIFVSLMFANIGFAEIRLLEEKYIKVATETDRFGTVCIDGYKFVFSRIGNNVGQAVSMVQAFGVTDILGETNVEPMALPTKC